MFFIWMQSYIFVSCQLPPLTAEVPIPQVPVSVCSFVELQIPLPLELPSLQSKLIVTPLTGVALVDEPVVSNPETAVVLCVITPLVIVPVLGEAAPAGHL